MTISGTTNRNQYTGNGVTTVFARTFFVSDADHLKVFHTIGGTTAEVTSGITKSGIGSASGNVTFDTAPASGTTITLIREVPVTQETDYVSQGAVSTEQVERDFDLLVQMIQDRIEEIGRTLKVPVTSSLSNLSFPTPVGGAAIGWNAGGTALVNLTTLDGEVPVTAGTDNAVMRYDNGEAGLQESVVIINDSGDVSGVADLTMTGTLSVGGSVVTAAGLALMDDANAAAQRATLGLGALATKATVATTDIDNGAVTIAKVADAALSGSDATLITGTAGTNGQYAQWNADGDIIGVAPPSNGISGSANSRSAANTTAYQNTQGKPIACSMSVSINANSNMTVEISPDNSTWYTVVALRNFDGVSAQTLGAQWVVPDTWYYRQTSGNTRTVIEIY